MSEIPPDEIRERLASIEARITEACRAAGRARSEVRLVAVSKKQPLASVLATYAAGQRVFGENYVQELEARVVSMPPDVDWHFVGHLQTNKARKVAELAGMVHTVDSERLAIALDRASTLRASPLPVLLQVNIDREGTKSGVLPEGAETVLASMQRLTHLSIQGLMAIPNPEAGARPFAALRLLAGSLRKRLGLPLPELSMGMSADFEQAVSEGATLVRIGTEIFGARGPRI